MKKELNPVYKDYEMDVTNFQRKMEFSFIGLIFASLALSLQFSPGFGNQYKVILIISWVLYLISIFSGLYRIFNGFKITVLNLKVLKGNLSEIKFEEATVKTQGIIAFLSIIQIAFYVLALILNIAFASLNYL